MDKPKVCLTPIIRTALDDVISRINRSTVGVTVTDADRECAQLLLDRLAEFASENACDPRDDRTDSIAASNAWIDQKWADIQERYFDKLRRIAEGHDEINESNHDVIRVVVSIVVVKMMVSIRSQILERLIR